MNHKKQTAMPDSDGFFRFTRRERNGALVLLFFCFTGLLLPTFFNGLHRTDAIDFEAFERQVTAIEKGRGTASAVQPVLFPFDPNVAVESEWQRLGLQQRVVQAILNYRKKGGRFRRPEDLKRIYTLSPADFLRLEPFIRIGEHSRRPARGRWQNLPEKPVKQSLREPFPFDPNSASREELLSLGLPSRTVALLLRYREKGGRFRSPGDLEKIYGISQADVQRLIPFVRISGNAPEHPLSAERTARPEQTLLIDINLSDTAGWSRLAGIGPVLSRRIVNFREKLGGFARIEQVGETFGLADTVFSGIRPFLRASPVFRPLAINRESWQGLSAHPYVSQRQAKAIVSFRELHGPFRSAADLDQLKALTSEWKEMMAPYWSFE